MQFAATTDADDNLATITRLAQQAARDIGPEGDHLLVLPEGAMHDFGPADLPLGPAAQPLDGPYVATLAKLATTLHVTIVGGMFESSADPHRPYNTLVVVDPDGELVATYRKTYLYDSFGYRESDRLLPGDGRAASFRVGGLTLGLLTCYDLRFPELAQSLVVGGADTLVVPSAWVRGPLKEDHWATLVRARAIENTAYVLGAGQCGRSYIGSSLVVDPMGVVLAGLGNEEGVASARLDPGVVHLVRRRNPSLANRRPSSVS